MNGHPALAYMLAIQQIEDRKRATDHHGSRSRRGRRTRRPGRLRISPAKVAPGVTGTV